MMKMCPKCSCTNIIRIPGNVGAYGSGNNVSTSMFYSVKVTRYLCENCGFSEEWVDSKGEIERIKKKYSC